MMQWAAHHIVWFCIRMAVTCACIWTVQVVISSEGYRVAWHTLVISTVCLIVVTRFWAARSTETTKE